MKPINPSSNDNQKTSFRNYLLFDRSTQFLLVSNLLVIVLAVVQNWNLATLLIVYWFQSVIIGFFSFFRILALKNFSTKNFYINKRPAEPTQGTKRFTAFFFALHYGMFHFGYLIFIISTLIMSKTNINGFYILFGVLVFGVNHFSSHRHNKLIDEQKKQNIGSLMFMPYLRIVPMHVIAASGAFLGTGSLITFLVLKTVADLVMHTVKHKLNSKMVYSTANDEQS
jgi:hypothetical protein